MSQVFPSDLRSTRHVLLPWKSACFVLSVFDSVHIFVIVFIHVQGQYVLVYNGPSQTELNYVNVSGIQGHRGPSLEGPETPASSEYADPRRAQRRRRRKRGKRGGLHARLKACPSKPPLPSLLLANVRSLENKLDELRARITSQRETREGCALISYFLFLRNLALRKRPGLCCSPGDPLIVPGGPDRCLR